VRVAASDITRVLTDWLGQQRWFAGKSRQYTVTARLLATLADKPHPVQIWIADVQYPDALEHYQVPLVNIVLEDSLASLPTNVATTEQAALDAAFQNRNDLRALELQAQSARQQASAIKKEALPTVGVLADYGLSQRNGRSYLPTYDLGLSLTLPIFDGFRREGRVEEQTSTARDLENRARDLRVQVEADVRTAVLNLASSTEAVAAARERLALAEQEVSQARERFQAGVAGNADVITAALSLNAARTLLVDALTSYQASRVALARAQGVISTLDR